MAKRKVYQHRFDLYADDAGDVDLHRYLLGLAGVSKASDWIRGTLKAIMMAQRAALDVPAILSQMDMERRGSVPAPANIPGRILKDHPIADEPHYEPPEDIA